MHPTPLIQVLERYDAPDEQQRLFRQAMLDFAAQHADCFERSCPIGHFTGSAWLVNQDNTRALLMHHAKLDRWFQLGGHADGDSDLSAVALKEAQEESGIGEIEFVSPEIFDLDIHEIPANSKDAAHFHYDVRFWLRVRGDAKVTINSESKELRWVSQDPSQLPTKDASVVRMFKKWVRLA